MPSSGLTEQVIEIDHLVLVAGRDPRVGVRGQIQGEPQLGEQREQLAQLGTDVTAFDGDEPGATDPGASSQLCLAQTRSSITRAG